MTRDSVWKLNPTELFLLALVTEGRTTFYSLRVHAELSPGTAQRYLNRLAKEGLVKRAPAGERGRRDFMPTQNGAGALKPAWEWTSMSAVGADFISVIRVAWVGWLLDPAQAVDFLQRAAAARSAAAEAQQARAAELSEIGENLLTVYSWMRAVAFAEQFRSEATTFHNLAQKIRSLPQPQELTEGGGRRSTPE